MVQANSRVQQEGIWICWLLLITSAFCSEKLVPDSEIAGPADGLASIDMSNPSTGDSQVRGLLATLTLYCNITGSCHPCRPEHMKSEACRPSGHAEKLSCTTSSTGGHQVTLHLHRKVNVQSQPLHISRSCLAPGSKAATAAGAAAANTTAAITQHDSDAGVSESNVVASKPSAGQLYFPRSRVTGAGPGLNILYFELGMVLMLTGSLPVVYIRKRRYVRL